LTTVSSGTTTTTPAAAPREATAATCKREGEIPTAEARRGRAPGAKSTILGRIGSNSGPEASTRTRISGLLAARSRRGSSLVREIPAS